MKFKPLLIIFTILTLVSCSIINSDSKTNSNSSESEIIGQWKWIQSTHGWAGQTFTPESVGYTQQLNYFADNTFSHFQADTLVKSGKYSLEKQNGSLVISYETASKDWYPDQRVEFKTNDIIELLYSCFDCPANTYKRID